MKWLLCTILLLSFETPSFAQAPPKYPALPSETPASFKPTYDGFDYARRDVMIPMRDGVKLHTVILHAEGREGRADPPDAHALRRGQAHHAHATARTSASVSGRLRQRRRDDRRGGLHPRRPGHARQVRLRGRLRDEPAAARPAEPDARRSRDGHLGHDRLAREERPGDERQGRHPRDLVQRLPAADGARQSAPGAQGLGADEPDGGRLDRRRLVPQRRVPPAGMSTTSTTRQATRKGDAKWWSSHYDEYDMFLRRGRPASSARRRGLEQFGFWKQARSSTRATTPSGATRPSTRSWRRSR